MTPKEEQDSKKDIAKRLRWSNERLWKSLSEQQKEAAVNKYYNFSSVEDVGLRRVIEDNRNLRRDFGFLMMSVLLGVLGGVVSSVLVRRLPDNVVLDAVFGFGFLAFLVFFIRSIDKFSAQNLGDDNVLMHLTKVINEEKNYEK